MEREFYAIQEQIVSRTVGILANEAHCVGTGTLVKSGDRNFLLTANHVVETVSADLRFFLNPSGSLQEASMLNLGWRQVSLHKGQHLSLTGQTWRDVKNDVCLLELSPTSLPTSAQLYDIDTPAAEVRNGDSVLITGFPTSNSAVVGPGIKAVGAVSENATYDDTVNETVGLPSSYDPEDQFLLHYSWRDTYAPHGFSGAAAWCVYERLGRVWCPTAALVGVQTGYLRSQNLLVIAGRKCVLRLIERALCTPIANSV